MKDQYGNAVPNDLVLLPNYTHLDEERKKVFEADWYDIDGIIWVSAKAIDYLSESDVEDSGINISGEIMYVDHCLKRGNEIDGFYHA